MHHTKDKGDLGVLKAQVDLAEKGYMVLLPLTEHAPFDLVAYREGRFLRIQVKYRSAVNGAITVRLRTSWADRNGTHERPLDKNELDVVCVYCPETDECYYFDPNQCRQGFSLRVGPAKNHQVKSVHLIEDYRRIP
jgi:hypothetical protein